MLYPFVKIRLSVGFKKQFRLSNKYSGCVRRRRCSLNSSAAQQASTRTDDTRSDKREETQTKSRDLCQNFRGKTPNSWTHHWRRVQNFQMHKLKRSRAKNSESSNNGRNVNDGIVEFYWPLCSSDEIKACQQHLLVSADKFSFQRPLMVTCMCACVCVHQHYIHTHTHTDRRRFYF